MSRSGKNKKVRAGGNPPGKQIRTGGDPENFDKESICWQTHRADWDHPDWGWNALSPRQWSRQVRDTLSGLETMTWAEIRGAVGGKTRGTNHHSIPVENLCKAARDRLTVLRIDSWDTVFSLRVSNTTRIYGLKDGRALKVLWYDPHHGDPRRAVCPSNMRHT